MEKDEDRLWMRGRQSTDAPCAEWLMGRGPTLRTTLRIFTFLGLSPTTANIATRHLTSGTSCTNMSTPHINRCPTIENDK